MKITLRRNTRKKTASITFRAGNEKEGVALAKAVLALGASPKPIDSDLPLTIVKELQKNGVEKADFDLMVETPKKRSS